MNSLDVLRRLALEVDDEFKRRRPQALVTWSWVEHAAARVRRTAGTKGCHEAVVTLLCAVGNFKRQAPIFLGAPATEVEEQQASPAPIELVGLQPDVTVDAEPEAVQTLTQVTGIGTATATAVLAGLYPRDHAIMDRRSAPVAAAWARALELDVPGPHRYDNAPALVSDAAYMDWYHGLVHALAAQVGTDIRRIERVCFLAPVENSGYGSWNAFAENIVAEGQKEWSRGG